MAERLGEVAEHALAGRVVLLGQQAEVVAQAGQVLVQRFGFSLAAQQNINVCQPERTHQEGALPRRQAVAAAVTVVAHQQAVLQQALFNLLQRA
ncbi:hypothetical protein D3C76_1364130 [compost metagenome]